MKIYIDGKETEVLQGETILEVCRRTGAEVPSLCYAEKAEHKPSCMVCMVRNEASGQMLPSCSTYPSDGMRIDTVSEEVASTRKLAVELLLSDHRADCEAPCTMACPRGLDVAEMLRCYDNEEYGRAKSVLAGFSGCEGCKAPCEKVCRRGTVDTHVRIREIVEELSAMSVKPEGNFSHSYDKSVFSSRLGSFSPAEKAKLKETVQTPSTCLHCACLAKDDCRLRDVATAMQIKSPRFGVSSSLPFKAAVKVTGRLVFEPAKCIRCGLCVYNTSDGFTFKGRGFGMQVIIPEESFSHVGEDIATLCPTGALSLDA